MLKDNPLLIRCLNFRGLASITTMETFHAVTLILKIQEIRCHRIYMHKIWTRGSRRCLFNFSTLLNLQKLHSLILIQTISTNLSEIPTIVDFFLLYELRIFEETEDFS